MKQPVFLFAFANDPKGSLRLGDEQNAIINALFQLEDEGTARSIYLGYVTLEIIFENLERFNNRIIGFHFAGHSSEKGIALVDTLGKSETLAAVLGRQKQLKIVFLNGCANHAQVESLWDEGVRSVIATTAPINDETAVNFAKRFYKSLASGQSIGDSFDSARSFVSNNSNRTIREFRGLSTLRASNQFPWGLYVQDENVLNWSIAKIQPKKILDPLIPKSNFLKRRPMLRTIFGVGGMIIYMFSMILFAFWNTPILSLMNTGGLGFLVFIIGTLFLYLWYSSWDKKNENHTMINVLKALFLGWLVISTIIFVISAIFNIPEFSWLNNIWLPNLFAAASSFIWFRAFSKLK